MENKITIGNKEKTAEQVKESFDNGVALSRIEKIVGDMSTQELLDVLTLHITKTAEELVEEVRKEDKGIIFR